MNSVRYIIISCAIMGATVPTTYALPVIEWNTVDYHLNPGTFSFFTEFPYSGGDGADIWGVLTLDPGGLWAELDAQGGTLGIAHKWFLMDYGELIDAAAADDPVDPFAITYFSDLEYYSTVMDVNQSIYIGFQLGSMEFSPFQTQYGWVELIYDGDSINYVSSATERTGLGIYAGTGMAVPEPATIGLLSIGALGLAWRRRNRKP